MLQHPQPHHIPQLKTLWKSAFGDSDAFLDAFFDCAFAFDRCLCLTEGDTPIAAAYWLPGTCAEAPVAYLYAITTAQTHRNQGHFHRLMKAVHETLKIQGYAGSLLVPAQESLFGLYGSLGYAPCCPMEVLRAEAGEKPVALTVCTAEAYRSCRAPMAPEGEFAPGEEMWRLLEKDCFFAIGRNFCLCGILEGDTLYAQEFLGDRAVLPGILKALNVSKGVCKTPGTKLPRAMFFPLQEGAAAPNYLGFPLE